MLKNLPNRYKVAVLPVEAVLDPNLSDGAFRVLACFSAHGNWDFMLDHSPSGLAAECGISPRMVGRYRQELIRLGYFDEKGTFAALIDPNWSGYTPKKVPPNAVAPQVDFPGSQIEGISNSESLPGMIVPEKVQSSEKSSNSGDLEQETPIQSDYDIHFDAWWDIYPRKEGKGAARRGWMKALKIIGGDDAVRVLQEKTVTFRKICDNRPRSERKYIPHPVTWLNQERWEDEMLKTHEDDSEGSLAPEVL